MKLSKIAPLEKWIALEDYIQELSGLDVAVFDAGGIKIADNQTWVNTLCPLIKGTDKGLAFICAVANKTMAAMAQKSKAPVIEECDGGLMKVVVPIFNQEQFLGVISGCGMSAEHGEVDTFLISKTTGIPEEELVPHLESITPLTRAKAEEVAIEMEKGVDQLLYRA